MCSWWRTALRRCGRIAVDRTVDMQSVITKGLSGGETVVLDGQLQLVDGARVAPRGSGKPGT